MDTRTQLIVSLFALMAIYVGIASTFVTESQARVIDIIDPSVATAVVADCESSSTVTGHYDLYVMCEEDGEEVEKADLGLFRHAMKSQLQKRFHDVQIRSAGETAQQPNLGTIVVTLDEWRESRYWSEACAQTEDLVIPVYMAMHMRIISRPKPSSFDGHHRFNSDMASLHSEDPISCKAARRMQVHHMISDMLDNLPRVQSRF